jgi:hypothetical protein
MPLDDVLRDAVDDVRLQAEELFSERGNLTHVIGKLGLPTHLPGDGHDYETNTPFDFEGMLKLSVYRRVTGLILTRVACYRSDRPSGRSIR